MLAGGVLFAVVRARGPAVRVALVERGDLEQHVVASGRVWVASRVQIAAQAPGLVVRVAAASGQHVEAGDLLVQQEDAEALAGVAQAKAGEEQARARMSLLRRVGATVANESLREADTNWEHALGEFGRVQKLASSGSVAPFELDDARRSLDLARAQRAAATAQQQSSAPAGADSRIALSALTLAQAQLGAARVRLAQTRIVAQQPGVVLSRSVEQGDVVAPARTLMVLAADGDTFVVIQLDERNLASIALGQSARAVADAYPDRPFDAQVSYVAPSVDPQRGSIEVRLRVPKAPLGLRPEMTVSVDLTVASKLQVLTLPTESVHALSSPSPWVLAVEHDRAVRREVTLGIRGSGRAEVAAGVGEGARVVAGDGQAVTPGQRVRAEHD